MPLSPSRNVYAEDRPPLRDQATVLMSRSRGIATDTDRSTSDSRKDSANPSRDCNVASIRRESLKIRVDEPPVYGDHSRANSSTSMVKEKRTLQRDRPARIFFRYVIREYLLSVTCACESWHRWSALLDSSGTMLVKLISDNMTLRASRVLSDSLSRPGTPVGSANLLGSVVKVCATLCAR